MGDLIQVLISARLDEATKKQLQAELDQIAKKASNAVSATRKKSSDESRVNNELEIKLSKAREAAEARRRKSLDAQDKAIAKSQDEQEKALNETIKITQKLESEEKKRIDSAIKESERLLKQKRLESDANDRLADQARKYAINQQQLASGQQGTLTNRLQGMVVGKDSLLAGSPALSNTYKTLEADISKFGQTGGKTYKQLNSDLGKFNNSLREQALHFKNNNHDGYNMIEMLGIAAKKYAIWMLTTTATMQAFRAVRDAVKYVMELDNALNDVRIVTGYSQEQVESLADSYGKLAKEMSVTTLEIAKQSSELYRQGLADKDVEERMKGIIKYAKISGLSIDESGKIITATMNATGRSISDVTNIFAYLGDMTAAGADEIGQSLQAVASSSDIAGLSLERTSAYIATISSITRQSASTIGRSLNSVLSRYQSIKEKGFNEEDAVNLNQVTKALNAIGVTAVDSSGQLRNFGDVLDELGPRFKELDTNQRNYIATTLFGTYQMNRGLTLLSNYSIAMDNYEMAINSAGTAQEKFNIYQQGTRAHLDRMTASWQNIGKQIFDSNIIKTFIDIAAGAADAVPVILALTSAMAGFFIAIKIGVSSTAIQTWLGSMITGLGATTTAAMTATVAFGALSSVGIGALIVGIGLLIKYLSDQFQKIQETKQAVNELNEAYADLGSNPTDEQMARYKSAAETRIELIDKEIEMLKERRKLELSILEEYGIPQETPPFFKNVSAWFGEMGKGIDKFWEGVGKSTEQKLQDAENERQNVLRQSAEAEEKAANVIGKRTNEIERAIRTTKSYSTETTASKEELEKLEETYKKASSNVSDYQSQMSSLASQYDSINKGENISKENLLQLLADYPEYTDQIIKNVGTKEGELKLTNILFDAVKEKYIMEQQMAIEAAKSVAVLNNANIDGLRLTERYLRTMIANSDLPSTVVDNLRTQLAQIDELMYGSTTMAEIKARQNAIFAMRGVTASDFNYDGTDTKTDGPVKDPNADAIKSAQDAQSAITDIIESEVDKRKKAIEDYYETELDAIQKISDANEKQWAEEDYKDSVADQMDSLKKLNEEKSKYMAAALSGDLTAQKKIREIDEDIAAEKEKLTDTQVENQRNLQKQALDDKKTALEAEKKLELDKLETVFDKSKVTATALQSLFASNLDGFNSILTTYLKNLGIAESEIKKIIGGVTNTFGQASAGVAVAKSAGVSASEFPSYAEGGKSPMQVAMENSSYGQKIGAKGIENDLKTLLSLQQSWAGATDKQAVNDQANAIRKKYGITDPAGYIYPAWSYAGSYANGGQVSTTGMAILHGSVAKPEYVLNSYQAGQAVMGNFQNTPLREVAKTTNNMGGFSIGTLINVEGNLDKNILPDVERLANQVYGRMELMFKKMGQTRFA